LSVDAGSSSFSAMIYLLIMGEFNTKLRDVVHRSSRNDKLAFNEQIELFSGGFKLENWFENKGYVSFGMYQEFDFMMFMPRYSYAFIEETGLSGKSFNLGFEFKN
jgi:hypothetical protein